MLKAQLENPSREAIQSRTAAAAAPQPTCLKETPFSNNMSDLTVFPAFYVDRFGRRTFMLIGSTGCTISLIFLCALSATFLGTENTHGLNAAVFLIWFYIFWWCFFVDATQYVYVSEIWPNQLRAQGTALGLAFFYLASEVTLVAAPVALNDIGWR